MGKKVFILLSTYNAQEYLAEQLDSLERQTYKNIEILVRDDGSADRTIDILKQYCERYNNLTYYQGENVGAANSFFHLMKKVKEQEFAYCAFCDQDDVWLPDKIERAVNVICSGTGDAVIRSGSGKGERTPVLYCSRAQLADASLRPMEEQIKKQIRPAFANALVENIVTGCTTVLNRAMYEVAVEHIPQYCIMHDWWLYLLATCFGTVLYDETSHILYRQHGNNVMGIDGTYKTEMRNRVKKYAGRRNNICIQAGEYCRLLKEKGEDRKMQYASCYHAACVLADYKKHLKNRLLLSFGRVVYRQRKSDDAIYRILFLLRLR